jgi:hypothetical protein
MSGLGWNVAFHELSDARKQLDPPGYDAAIAKDGPVGLLSSTTEASMVQQHG